jgi:hypothetical protein
MPQRDTELILRLSGAQSQVFHSSARFRVLVAGRRFGKTQLALIELLRAAWEISGCACWYIAPSYRQAKRIAWRRLKSLVRSAPGVEVFETELTVTLPNSSSISLRGADSYDSLRGDGLDFVVLDEFASMKPEVWSEVLRPALADRHGRALFIGTPQGHNHLYDRFQFAQAESGLDSPAPEWGAFQYSTLDGGFVTEQELASAARELDPRLYSQEFEARFENTALGLAYHAFSRTENVRRCDFSSGSKLIWSLDFNVNPMCSIIAQRSGNTVEVLDELVLDNANTLLACQRFWERTAQWRTRYGIFLVEVYGDASGHQRRTSGAATDWSLIRDFFAQRPGQVSAHIRAASANPSVRDRVNVVNARLLNASGDRHLFIDPRCKELISDLERVCWRADEFGQPGSELDKSDRMRTHLTDALGYYLAQGFPMYGSIGERHHRLF